MATKKELLKNLRKYSPEEIAEAVRAGKVSLYELSKETEGAFTPLLKKKVKALLEQTAPITATNMYEQTSVNPISEVPETNSIEQNGSLVIETTDVIQQTDNNTTCTIDEQEHTTSNKGMFKRPFSFHGRIRRTEYGISFIIYFIWAVILNISTQSNDAPEGMAIFLLVTYIPMIWFLWAQNCKRCHDRGNSGWYQLIPFYFFVLLFGDGEEGTNDYGDNPKD